MVNTDGFWPMFIQCKPWQSTRDNQSIERGRNTILKGYYNSTSVLWRILMLESLNVRTGLDEIIEIRRGEMSILILFRLVCQNLVHRQLK